jgi:hypothetical protein
MAGLQQLRRHPGLGEQLVDRIQQSVMGELPRRKINGHRDGRKSLVLPGHVLTARGL